MYPCSFVLNSYRDDAIRNKIFARRANEYGFFGGTVTVRTVCFNLLGIWCFFRFPVRG